MSAYTTNHQESCTAPLRRNRASLLSLFALARQRRELASLNDERLRDLGLTRADASAEAARSFWDTPANWKR